MTMTEHILAVLKAEGQMSGPDLVHRCGGELSHARSRVWTQLRKLYDWGHIQKAYARSRKPRGRGANRRITIWRLA